MKLIFTNTLEIEREELIKIAAMDLGQELDPNISDEELLKLVTGILTSEGSKANMVVSDVKFE